MGMYTELHFNAELKRDAPEQVREILRFMTGGTPTDEPPTDLPDHPLFKTRRWEHMLLCSSYYFPAQVASALVFDQGWYINVRCNLKNYDDEIGAFLNWVMPYVDAGTECLGYYRYEEDDHPTLIYKRHGSDA